MQPVALLQIMGLSWFLSTPTDLAYFYQLLGLEFIVESSSEETDNLRCPWCFAKQIIRDLVLSCIVVEEFNLFVHVENLLDKIWTHIHKTLSLS